jgi:hypothetical protein
MDKRGLAGQLGASKRSETKNESSSPQKTAPKAAKPKQTDQTGSSAFKYKAYNSRPDTKAQEKVNPAGCTGCEPWMRCRAADADPLTACFNSQKVPSQLVADLTLPKTGRAGKPQVLELLNIGEHSHNVRSPSTPRAGRPDRPAPPGDSNCAACLVGAPAAAMRRADRGAHLPAIPAGAGVHSIRAVQAV